MEWLPGTSVTVAPGGRAGHRPRPRPVARRRSRRSRGRGRPGRRGCPLIAELAADLRDHPTPAVRYSVLYADAMLASDETALARFEAALAADLGGSPLAEARLRLAYGSWLRRRPGAARGRRSPPGIPARRRAPAHSAGTADRPAGRPRPVQPGDRRATVPLPPHGRITPVPPVPQTRDHHPGPARQRAQTITTGEGGTATSAPGIRHGRMRTVAPRSVRNNWMISAERTVVSPGSPGPGDGGRGPGRRPNTRRHGLIRLSAARRSRRALNRAVRA